MPKINQKVNVVTLSGLIKRLTEISLKVPMDSPVVFSDEKGHPGWYANIDEKGLEEHSTFVVFFRDMTVLIADRITNNAL